MENILGVLLTGLIFLLVLEIRGYYNYIKAAEAMTNLGAAMQAAFEGVRQDVTTVNEQMSLTDIRLDRLDESTTILNSNDAIIEIYLNLFRDALGLEADKLSRIGTLKFPEGEIPKNLE